MRRRSPTVHCSNISMSKVIHKFSLQLALLVQLIIGLLTERTSLFSLFCLLEGWLAEAKWTSVHALALHLV